MKDFLWGKLCKSWAPSFRQPARSKSSVHELRMRFCLTQAVPIPTRTLFSAKWTPLLGQGSQKSHFLQAALPDNSNYSRPTNRSCTRFLIVLLQMLEVLLRILPKSHGSYFPLQRSLLRIMGDPKLLTLCLSRIFGVYHKYRNTFNAFATAYTET